MIVGVGERWGGRIHNLRFHYFTNDDHMGPHIQGGDHAAGKTGADPFGGVWIAQAVASLGNAVILIHILARLETEPLDLLHLHILGQDNAGKCTGRLDQLQCIIVLFSAMESLAGDDVTWPWY